MKPQTRRFLRAFPSLALADPSRPLVRAGQAAAELRPPPPRKASGTDPCSQQPRESPGRGSLLREDDLAVPAPRQPSTLPLPGRELHLPRRQCIPTPSHQENLIKLPPNLCAKVVRNTRAVFHKKYESERSQARKVSGRRFTAGRPGSACLQRELPSPRRVPQQAPGNGSFGRG